jgi:hypothetical protein
LGLPPSLTGSWNRPPITIIPAHAACPLGTAGQYAHQAPHEQTEPGFSEANIECTQRQASSASRMTTGRRRHGCAFCSEDTPTGELQVSSILHTYFILDDKRAKALQPGDLATRMQEFRGLSRLKIETPHLEDSVIEPPSVDPTWEFKPQSPESTNRAPHPWNRPSQLL